MARAKAVTADDVEQMVEQKLLEIIGDPDSGLHLKKEFKTKLEQRLKKPSKRISHEEVLKRFA
ncbi:MAG: hypothetical protein QMD07_00695 [Thermodesulfovibrionales bacterium]|nr:hypothetical protein [Thermodesulfovibrionales bacterium]